MRIGYLCEYSEKEIAFAKEAGFESMELIVGPGSPLDPERTARKDILEARDRLAEADIEVSAIGYYDNHLDADEGRAKAVHEHFRGLFKLAGLMGVDCVCSFAGRRVDLDIADNIPFFRKVWARTAKQAEDLGLKIGFENCPMFHYFPYRGINIAYTPRAWDMMFEAVDSPALGLEYDPSHLVCLLIDYLQVIRCYGSRIVHVHAKDAEVLWHNVAVNGLLEPESVRHRTPGMGVVNWAAVCSTLIEHGYEGNLDIEGRHDPIYHGPRENEGLVISLRHLKQFTGREWVH
jgi:sugar phosphate isomerase/epimerase